MLTFADFLNDLTNPALAFLPKAVLVAALSSIVCGLVGVHVVLRGMAFIGDAVAHAVFPGIAVAFVFQGSYLLGGAVAGIGVAIAVALFAATGRVKEDSLIGILMAAAFAAGLVIISRVNGYTASLSSFLFGSITGVTNSDIAAVGLVGLAVAVVTIGLHHKIVTVSLDRESAQALGLKVTLIDTVLYVCVAAAVVISVATVGNILVLALLVTPAATARLLSNSVAAMLVMSPAIGAVGSFFGIYLAWSLDVPTGAAIVLVLAVLFMLVWVFGPTGPVREKLVRTNSTNQAATAGTATTSGVDSR
ncbi:anchored repeat-type ABC transporter permease subunit [Corynebacterium mendelii]|uniref:Anchored repeat-type ABC transporter permease subunit n=1 Tax=Corynebacterium mendelii TaxID=2765362 RepID=A0A939E3C4_9CORY|nr:anchored repeat-type ABC transporter permease subunit [Corynebacterium mendelii]MBN9645003.1 anchored repeat-type ABC transporter permease subunit [Corynebacterium mendelii]